jgi:hypothetical protein
VCTDDVSSGPITVQTAVGELRAGYLSTTITGQARAANRKRRPGEGLRNCAFRLPRLLSFYALTNSNAALPASEMSALKRSSPVCVAKEVNVEQPTGGQQHDLGPYYVSVWRRIASGQHLEPVALVVGQFDPVGAGSRHGWLIPQTCDILRVQPRCRAALAYGAATARGNAPLPIPRERSLAYTEVRSIRLDWSAVDLSDSWSRRRAYLRPELR